MWPSATRLRTASSPTGPSTSSGLQVPGPVGQVRAPGSRRRLLPWFEVTKPEENNIAQTPSHRGEYLGKTYVLAYDTSDMGLLNDDELVEASRGAPRSRPGRTAGGRVHAGHRAGQPVRRADGNNINRRWASSWTTRRLRAEHQLPITTNGIITAGSARPRCPTWSRRWKQACAARLKKCRCEKSVGPCWASQPRQCITRPPGLAVVQGSWPCISNSVFTPITR